MDIANFKERIAKALAPEVFERAEAAKRRLRPPLETIFQMGYQESEAGVKLPNVPRFKGSYRQLYNVVYSLYILRQVIEKITQETFRNVEDEWEWIPKFAARCAVCGAEYEKEEPEQCEECGSNQFIYPDEKQKELFEEFVEKANANGQSLFDVLREISKDLDIADDAYLVVLKDYVLTHDGHIFQAIPKEILRGSPETFRLVANDDGFPGGRWWKCLHPGCNYVLEEPDREKAKHARCPEHNMILHDVWYVVIDPRKQEKPVRYYLKNEVFHASKHNPTLLYGFSPVITLYSIAEALLAMVGYIRDTYLLERPPKAGLFVQTSNPKSLEKVWDEAMQKKKTNPNYLPVIAIEGEGRTGAQFVSFMDSIEELQYLAVLEEFRRGISAQYGVSLIFQSDTSASGGLNSEGLQITVTNRAVESARTAIQKFIIFLMEQFSITDWMFMLPPVEERDEMAEKQRFAQEVQNATGMLRLGYVPTLEDNLTFSYEYDPILTVFSSRHISIRYGKQYTRKTLCGITMRGLLRHRSSRSTISLQCTSHDRG
ncbi:hypothetical protein B6U67_00775 [Methanosarcinales archaeon ex4484_138]|nr:MAG: hypothetical protein B6U67_00775 [Methanosarcinales archaeon ex4484_138]